MRERLLGLPDHPSGTGRRLNLLVAAIVLRNTKYLEVAYMELRRQGRKINEDLLRHVAPFGWERTSG